MPASAIRPPDTPTVVLSEASQEPLIVVSFTAHFPSKS